jgi:hypothetical protein
MNPVLAFTVIMAIWTVSDFLSKMSKGLVSSLFVASLIFLVGFLSGLFPSDLLTSSSLGSWSGSSSSTSVPSSASTISSSSGERS